MKRHLTFLFAGLAGCLWLGTVSTRADLEVSASVSISAHADFYEPLEPHGGWVEVESYGRCWRPGRVAVSWQPYSDGHWEWTDCGWYWVSDEPWAWACYHYGYWVHHPHHSWIWIPGVEWAPAWVSWRAGGGYIGWAPLAPPHVRVGPTFMFVETRRFRERIRPTTVVVNNTTIINQTTVISNVRREERNVGGRQQRVVVNEGPGLEPVRKATGEQVRVVPIQEAANRTKVPAVVEQRSREKKAKGQAPGAEKPAMNPERKAPAPGVPATPDSPKPAAPEKPGKPALPDQPKQPKRPEPPAQPDRPVPAPPETPDKPNKPEKPDRVERDEPKRPAEDGIDPPRRETPPPPVQKPPPQNPGKKQKDGDPNDGKGHGKDKL